LKLHNNNNNNNNNKELLKLVLTTVSFNYNFDVYDNNSAILCELFGIPKCTLLIVHVKHGSEDDDWRLVTSR